MTYKFDDSAFGLTEGWVDMPDVDIRREWAAANENNELKGCGLHRDFSYDEIASLEESLRNQRIMADVPTPDVLEWKEKHGKTPYRHRKPCFANSYEAEEKEESIASLKKKLKQEILKELLEELKSKK
jgi:hypothetical protein